MKNAFKLFVIAILGLVMGCGYETDDDFESGPDFSDLVGDYSGELRVKSYLANAEETYPFEFTISISGTKGTLYNSNQEGLEFTFDIAEREDGNWSLLINNSTFGGYDLRQYEYEDITSSTFNPISGKMGLYFTLLDLDNTDDFNVCIGLADKQ
jgi:hypothetical protein